LDVSGFAGFGASDALGRIWVLACGFDLTGELFEESFFGGAVVAGFVGLLLAGVLAAVGSAVALTLRCFRQILIHSGSFAGLKNLVILVWVRGMVGYRRFLGRKSKL